jgi:septal ring factor EnvC (AmiA/AmiB activator)
MTEITLDFIAKQLARVLAEQSAFRDEMLVMSARIGHLERSLERLEAAVTVVTLEVRAVRNQLTRLNDRITKLEETSA